MPQAEGEEEEEDDLAAAFEVLDLARVLFTKKLEQPEAGEGTWKGKEVGDSSATRHDKERLADTHDLLAEISLENERYGGILLMSHVQSNILFQIPCCCGGFQSIVGDQGGFIR
jgi:hypothetical protein